MPLNLSCKEAAGRIAELLGKKGVSLSVAESCTGGMIGACLTAVPGASAFFRGGIIAYDNEVKKNLLGVPASTLRDRGAVSAETVMAMAAGAAHALNTDIAVAISGIAGPDGGTEEKPVGTVFIGFSIREKTYSFESLFNGDRQRIREQAATTALNRLLELIGLHL